MNTLNMIRAAVAKGNNGSNGDLEKKHNRYLESFKRNNLEEEYQEYTHSLYEIEQEIINAIKP